MKYFIEIILIDAANFSLYKLWSKLYTQVHLALVEQQNPDKAVNIGVSFPGYKYSEKDGKSFGTLGDKLRIFAPTESELQQLNLQKCLERLTDYLHIKSIQPVPENVVRHLLVRRYRADMNMERLTRRFMQRESKRTGTEISFAEAKTMQNQRFVDKQKVSLKEAEKHYQQPQMKEFPFIKLKSLSGKKDFSLQIEQIQAEQAKTGTFSTYGLSSHTTVPHW